MNLPKKRPSTPVVVFRGRRIIALRAGLNERALKAEMRSAYGAPSWRELDQVSQGYGWEWKAKGILVEARYDLTKQTTTVTLERSKSR